MDLANKMLEFKNNGRKNPGKDKGSGNRFK